MTARKVYIVLLNYIRWEDTYECIESVLKSSYENYRVVIVDNDSGNDSLQHIVERLLGAGMSPDDYRRHDKESFTRGIDIGSLPLVTLIQNDVNAGFAGGNNLVLRSLANEEGYVWLLNPDMLIREDALAELVNFAAQEPSECIIGAEIRPVAGSNEPPFYGGGRINLLLGTTEPITDADQIERLDYVSGGCLFTRAKNFRAYGLLPEEYFLYWEETDWGFSAKRSGALPRVCPSAVCYDKVSTTIGRGVLSDYYYCRNGLIFLSKFRARNVPIALCGITMRLLKRIVSGQWAKAWGAWTGTIDFVRGRTGKAR